MQSVCVSAFCNPTPLKRRRVHVRSVANPCCAAVCALSRRRVIQCLASLTMVSYIQRANAKRSSIEYPELRGLAERYDGVPVFRNQNGVKMQDMYDGTGDSEIQSGKLVSVKYVLRRSNGYFIDASYGFDRFETFTFRAGAGQVVQGFEAGLRGMKEGGRRRFIVPPELGYVDGIRGAGPIPPDFGAKRSLASHAREPLIFEVEVVKIR